jgi:DNA-binding CsgD family transcriptional regulator
MRCPELIGRDTELAALRAAVARGGVVAVAGEAGVGKSRLVEEATRDGAALHGRCVRGGELVPLRPLVEAFATAFRDASPPEPDELRPFRSSLGAVVPAWAAPEAPESSILLAEGIVRLLRAIGGRPLVIEDVHWADAETLSVIEYLADNLETSACIVTVRDEESSPGRDLVRRLRNIEVIALAPLDDAHVEHMATSLGAPAPSPTLIARTGGLPLVAEELLALDDGDHALPPSFADAVVARFDAIDGGREVIGTAALLGRTFDWRVLPAGSDDVLQQAVDVGLLVVRDDTFQFRHALTRDAILASLLPSERARWAASAYEAVAATDPVLAAELATIAGLEEQAAALLASAGRDAMTRGSLATAERLLRTAAKNGVDDPALVDLVAMAGKVDEAFELGERMLHAGTVDADEVHRSLARAALAAARWDAAEPHVEATGDPVLLAQLAFGQGEPDAALLHARSAVADPDPRVVCEAHEVIGRCLRLTDLDAAQDAFRAELEVADANDLVLWRIRALHELGTIDLLRSADPDYLQRARDAAVDAGMLVTVATLDLQLAACHGMTDFDRMTEAATRAATAAQRFGLQTLAAMATMFRAMGAVMRGDQREVDELVALGLSLAPDDVDVQAAMRGSVPAYTALLHDDLERFEASLDTAMEIVRRSPVTIPSPFRGMHAFVRALHGDRAGCEEARVSGITVSTANEGLVRLGEAVLANDEPAAGAAMGLMEPFPWTQHIAARLVAPWAIDQGWAAPVAWLRQAVPYFDDVGQDRVADACRSLLRVAGAPLPRRRAGDDTVPDWLRSLGVTRRELDVLIAVGEGLGNAEIGQRLFISPRTVEKHVAALMRKTGVDTRNKLVSLAASMGA